MDVPLALNDIGIRNGLKGNRKSSTFSEKTGVVGLSALIHVICGYYGYNQSCFCINKKSQI